MENLSLADVNLVFTTLVDAFPDIVFFKDPSGAFLYANPAFERLYGYTLEQMRETGAPGQDADAIEAATSRAGSAWRAAS